MPTGRDPVTDQRIEEIEHRIGYFVGIREPIAGERMDAFWLDIRRTTPPGSGGTIALNPTPIRALLLLAQRDVPDLLAEVKELREELERVQVDFERYYRAAGGTL